MTREVLIVVHTSNILSLVGRVYRNEPHAIKEYITNALDAWKRGGRKGRCRVKIDFHRQSIVVAYNAPGMTAEKFEDILQHVGLSDKEENLDEAGRLGIGLWNFLTYAKRAEFVSKYDKDSPALKVVLQRGREKAQFSTPTRKEEAQLDGSVGMVITITDLNFDPTNKKSPLAMEKLERVLAEHFDSYLRGESLEIVLNSGSKSLLVRPMAINLPKLAGDYSKVYVRGNSEKVIQLSLWFDASGTSAVSIRNIGIPIVQDVSKLDAFGLESSVFGSGYVFGFIDADFLSPQPARTSFETNGAWLEFIAELDRVSKSVEAEVDHLRANVHEEEIRRVSKEALDLAASVLGDEELKDLRWFDALRKPASKAPITGPLTPTEAKEVIEDSEEKKEVVRRSTVNRGDTPPTLKLIFQYFPFKDGPARHSHFVAPASICVNQINPDFELWFKRGSKPDKLRYIALLVGMEVVAFNDKTGLSRLSLDKLVSYILRLWRKGAK